MEGTGVGRQIISRVRDHPGVVIQNGAQVRGQRILLAGSIKEGSVS
jgi:hypothetical protein